jgi:hypothetical protein
MRITGSDINIIVSNTEWYIRDIESSTHNFEVRLITAGIDESEEVSR